MTIVLIVSKREHIEKIKIEHTIIITWGSAKVSNLRFAQFKAVPKKLAMFNDIPIYFNPHSKHTIY